MEELSGKVWPRFLTYSVTIQLEIEVLLKSDYYWIDMPVSLIKATFKLENNTSST
jgi:hypothetical protein